MTSLATRLNHVSFSQTIAVIRRVKQLRAQGKDVISLGAGEVDLPVHPTIRQAAAEAALRGEERSSPVEGVDALREAIADKFARENGLSYGADCIIVGTGSKQIIFNAFAATLDPGSEVIIPAPYWVSYPDMVRLADGVPRLVKGEFASGFKLSPDALEKTITPRTRWLVLNSPCNPTGSVYSAQELRDLADVLRRYPQVLVLSDDIYEALTFPSARFATLAQVAPDLDDRILTVNGFSKRYSLIGWRIGYAGGPRFLIEAMTRVQSQVTSGPATITQAGALAALGLPQEERNAIGAVFARRSAVAIAEAEKLPDIRFPRPEGAFYLFPDIAAHIGSVTPKGNVISDDVALAAYLLDEFGIVTLPGSFFGQEDALRLSFTCPEDVIRTAIGRIGDALSSLTRFGVASRRQAAS